MTKRTKKTLPDLAWADLEAWARARIVSRGTSYQKNGSVRDLAITPDGGLLAWVEGSRNYATTVSLEKGKLSSDCTCPYGGICKHAVAVVLEYLDHLKKNAKAPLASKDDERFILLEDEALAWEDDDDCVDFDDDEDWDEDDDLIPEAEQALDEIDASLRRKSKKELESMLAGVLRNQPGLKKKLGIAPVPPQKKGCAALVKAATKAIVIVSSESGWRDYWKHTGHTPDYSPVRKYLRQLLDEGCADDVVPLGEKLFTRGIEQVEQSHDEGETALEIANTMPLVIKALAKCSLSDTDKLERAVDFRLRDEYALCGGADEFLQRRFGKKVWSELADRLLARLGDWKPEREDSSFRYYGRDKLSNEVIRALEQSGRDAEALELCFREAELTGSYERLVKKLRGAGRTAEAEEWIRKGVKEFEGKLPGIVSSLKGALLEIRQAKKDRPFVAALRAEAFVASPSLQTYKDLQAASERAKVWPVVRQACMDFLEKGSPLAGKSGWPMPPTGFEKSAPRTGEKPPFTGCLIDIAIAEKRLDDALRWHEAHKRRSGRWYGADRDDSVAAAVVRQYPEKAVAIWKSIAESHIARTDVRAYGTAVEYLKKIRKVLNDINRTPEWTDYLAALTETNKRKSRLVQMLRSLGSGPILSSKPKNGSWPQKKHKIHIEKKEDPNVNER